MRDSVRVAAVALDSKPGQTDENLAKIAAWCSRAADAGAQLVLFPELSMTGFIPNHPVGDHAAWLGGALRAARRMAEPVPGPAVERLREIASATGLFISAGLVEDAGNLLYNTQVLVRPGALAGAWRKMHIPLFEAPFFSGGQAPAVAPTPLGRIGVNICFDAFLPESARLLAVRNAEIVLFPFAADPQQGWAAWAGPTLSVRCRENGVFGVACNYAGEVECAGARQRFPGGALIFSPAGETLAEGAGMLLAELSHETLLAARAEPEYLFRFRRPELYGPLAKEQS